MTKGRDTSSYPDVADREITAHTNGAKAGRYIGGHDLPHPDTILVSKGKEEYESAAHIHDNIGGEG